MKKKVSVLIPTYKNPDTIGRAVNSALNQNNFDDYEIIVVDDNDPLSEERKQTELAMKEFNSNSKVKYIKHKKNMNGAVARNTAFKNSSGELICFLDDDDIFLPDKLFYQVKYMDEHKEYDGSYTWRIHNGKVVKGTKVGDLSKDLLMLDFTPMTITIMIRRSCYSDLGGFDESFRRHQDFEFLLRFFKKYKLGVVEMPLSQVIGKNGNHTNVLSGRQLEELKEKFLGTFSDVIDSFNNKKIKKKIYASNYASVFCANVSCKKYAIAFKEFFKYSFKYGIYFDYRVIKHYIDRIINK